MQSYLWLFCSNQLLFFCYHCQNQHQDRKEGNRGGMNRERRAQLKRSTYKQLNSFTFQAQTKQDRFQTGFNIVVKTGLETGLWFYGCK